MTYEFKCPECKATDEFSVSINLIDTKVFFCVDCGCEMRRIFTAPAIILKGEGWASKDD
jgi:putative FmdB family regulatory protein